MPRDLSVIGRALAAPVRSTFVNLLMDGSSRPASELATSAGITASTASEHLAVLLDAGLVTSVARGRQRFYALADQKVAVALEQLGHLCPEMPVTSFTQRAAARSLAHARLCYDHLAGRLGVTIAEVMIADGWIDRDVAKLTPVGVERLEAQGISVRVLATARRPLIRPCPDWTERRPHIAGSIGAAIASHFSAQGWVVRQSGGRGLTITSSGTTALRTVWGTEVLASS